MTYCLFNTNDLNANGFEVLEVDYYDTAKALVNKHQMVRGDGEVITDKRYGERLIKLRGRVIASNRKDMETKLDTLKSYLTEPNKQLDIMALDKVRRFTATVTGFTTTVSGYMCNFDITFAASPFGVETAATAITLTTPRTAASASDANTFGGTYKAPVSLDFTITRCSPYWESKYIDLQNTVLNQKLRLNRVWGWSDRVVVNGEARTVSIYPATKTVIQNCDSLTIDGYTSWQGVNITASLDTTNKIEGVGCVKGVMAGATATATLLMNTAANVSLLSTIGDVLVPVFIPTPTSGTVAKLRVQITDWSAKVAYWDLTTQYDGSAIAYNAWNLFKFDSNVPTADSGIANRALLSKIEFILYATTTMQLNGVLLDYIAAFKANPVATTMDYQGNFVEFNPGSGTLVISDEFTTRSITASGSYVKRYL